MIIAIDGPAGAGKSTIAKLVSTRLSIDYLDTGAMYRAFTYELLANNINLDDIYEIIKKLKTLKIDFINNDIYVNNKNLSNEIRKEIVNINVSKVASISEVRNKLVEWQRKIANNKDCVLEGRDIGTVVFPNADYKFFLVASTKVRALRRYKELENNGTQITIEEVEQSIITRDYYDSNRQNSPLKKAKDAIEIDTSYLNVEQVVDKIIAFIKER